MAPAGVFVCAHAILIRRAVFAMLAACAALSTVVMSLVVPRELEARRRARIQTNRVGCNRFGYEGPIALTPGQAERFGAFPLGDPPETRQVDGH